MRLPDRPVDNASLAFLRIAFGLSIVAWTIHMFASGLAHRHYNSADLHFSFVSFAVMPSPGWLALELDVLLVAGLGVALGAGFRVSALVVCAIFTHLFLADRALYQNHHYLMCMLAALLAVSPAHRTFSVDAWLRPSLRADIVPGFVLFVFRAQLALVYVYAGIAKLNPDWLAGEPLRSWFSTRVDLPALASGSAPVLAAWCALAFDLLVVPALLWKKTRTLAFIAAVVFHASNAALWDIDVFPPLMLAATTVFFDPSWPRRFLRRAPSQSRAGVTPSWLVAVLALHLLVQVALPLRHHAIPGDVVWTDDGHRFSWRMMLRNKLIGARFYAISEGTARVIDHEQFLASWQVHEVLSRPDIARDFGKWLAGRAAAESGAPVAVHAVVSSRLNAHPEAILLDPRVDLGTASPDAPLVTITVAEDDVAAQASARAFAEELAALAQE